MEADSSNYTREDTQKLQAMLDANRQFQVLLEHELTSIEAKLAATQTAYAAAATRAFARDAVPDPRPMSFAWGVGMNNRKRKLTTFFVDPAGRSPPANPTANSKLQFRKMVAACSEAGKWSRLEIRTLRATLASLLAERGHDGDEERGGALDWSSVVAALPGKTEEQCRIKWAEVGPRDEDWTPAADAVLLDAAKAHNGHDWHTIANEAAADDNFAPAFSAAQCLERYQRGLNVEMKTVAWTTEEDAVLVEAVRLYGSAKASWTTIATCFDGRTATHCRERWMRTADPALRRGHWDSLEERQLYLGVISMRPALGQQPDWKDVAHCVPHRNPIKCREKFMDTLDPEINRADFTAGEILQLRQAVEEHGAGKWAKIAKEIPGRSDMVVCRAWERLMNKENKVKRLALKKAADEEKRQHKRERKAKRLAAAEKRAALKLSGVEPAEIAAIMAADAAADVGEEDQGAEGGGGGAGGGVGGSDDHRGEFGMHEAGGDAHDDEQGGYGIYSV